MKRVNNLYNEIVDIRKICLMYDKRIKINTKNKRKVERFENNYVSNIIHIKDLLQSKKYISGKYNIFIIKEPKIRLIMSQNMIDKIINHVISEYFLVRIFDNSLIEENIATRKNKGTHYGMKLIKKYLNKLKGDEFYILKFDIKKYFFNLDHEIIKKLLSRKIKDKDVLKILFNIINSTNEKYVNEEIKKIKEKEIAKIDSSNIQNKKIIKDIKSLPEYKNGKGLPIGNMSSQFIAIMYLNELDHFIKEKLKIKYYIRYMDDGILMHRDKTYLQYCLNEITKILEKYKLELNQKTKIINIKEGFDFLGFRYYIKNNKIIMKVRNQTKRRFKRKMKNLNKLVEKNKITKKELMQVKNSYIGHLSYGNCKNLIKKTISAENKKDNLNATKVKIIDGKIVYM